VKCVYKDSVNKYISTIARTLLKYVTMYVSFCTIIGVVLLILNIVPKPLMIFVKAYFGIVYAIINIIIGSWLLGH